MQLGIYRTENNMMFYIYSGVIPFAIIASLFWIFRPLNFQRVTRALTISIAPLIAYIWLIYFLEMRNYIDAGWVYWTLIFFFIPLGIWVLFPGLKKAYENEKLKDV